LEEARGEFIAYLDHDDFWLPHKIEQQLAAFEGKPNVGVVYCRWIDVDENRVPWPPERQITRLDWWKPETGSVYYWLIRRNSIVSMSIPLIRTAVLRSAGGFDPDTAPCDDWDLWLRMARRCHFEYVPQDLVEYTRHSGQLSADTGRMGPGEKKTMQKQWRYVLGKPWLLWFVATSVSFIDTLLLYREAKHHLFAAQRRQALWILLKVATRRPLALVSPQWMYLAKRLLMGNTAPY
jgi:glycosyltransferase involved in cell wall biosynthesis